MYSVSVCITINVYTDSYYSQNAQSAARIKSPFSECLWVIRPLLLGKACRTTEWLGPNHSLKCIRTDSYTLANALYNNAFRQIM